MFALTFLHIPILIPLANQAETSTMLEPGDVSLIPLVEEDDHTAVDTHEQEETGTSHGLMVDEAISIAHQLGMRAREVITGRQEDGDDDAMDIQVCVCVCVCDC